MYLANEKRYDDMIYNRCGRSGLKLPFLSLGLWHNFGDNISYDRAKEMILGSFDMGITHFDIANNYGPPGGSAEKTFGRVLKEDLSAYRDEIIISTKAGYYMWPGPYGEWGSKKNLIASLDQSLKRLGVDYVDIYYHHRPDPDTPIEESMEALAQTVRQGKALYVGLSNYNAEDTRTASQVLKSLGVKCLIHQPYYNMFDRTIEEGLLAVLIEEGIGAIPYSSLAQGILTDRYFKGIPEDSRAAGYSQFLNVDAVTKEKIEKALKLNELAKKRGQSLTQMVIAWNLRNPQITSLIIGASKLSQIEENVEAQRNMSFTEEELAKIDSILE